MSLWAFQSAMFSVPEESAISEVYKSRAILLLPMSILFVAQGVLFFIVLGKKSK